MPKQVAIGSGPPLVALTGHLLTWTEAAAVIGLSARTLRRLNAAGRFPEPVVIAGLRGRRFRREDIARWLDAAGEQPVQGE
ncbi:helix-turn-helix transcriptional regulator [Rubrivivax benzoatilyticus]|uniref:Helix-turn-helix domain-containing protein n=1 Tax=Rubrivivax benzoatilyticus TaxID=316997 RepID=A0ABX0HVC4_9BURK|nr:helix-turn-helix domain-containing protein [Rubrivivax benzoatilyticus]EGJ11961.1 hypothetical protein RBXJA2T_16602 [Rubrivivax benzoatilyticus JA2 = ATCC BAA-35]NHK97483.1 helix-turn-helix domain-containing protein [Rubrivivax benzoatilyticus]NHL22822.1 helix-turn-helix domain-containing protein [Rubrivivax benzoatilyticus]